MEQDPNKMSFLQHLEELRWRLARSAIAVLLFATVIFIFTEWIIEHLFLNLTDTNFITFRLLCDYFKICVPKITLSLQSTEMTNQFSTNMMLSIVGGIVCAFPYIFWELWGFVKPGLRQNESQAVKGITFYVSLLFFFGILFGYFIISPLCVQFFGNYTMANDIINNFRINSYISIIVSSTFYSGLLFLLPVLIYIFTKLGIVTSRFLKKYRKHALVIVLILSAIITPPDFFSQIIVSIPILILYEIGIIVAKRVEKQRA